MFVNFDDHVVLLSCQGGSILHWQWKEHTILGPTRMERVGDALKLRGESHWCYPNHGKGPDCSSFDPWPKHGFLRTFVTTPQKLSGNCAEFKGQFHSRYPFFHWNSQITAIASIFPRNRDEPDRLIASLAITNTSDPQKNAGGMPILPALHPYFNSEHGAVIEIGQKQILAGKDVLGPIVIERENPLVVNMLFGRVTMHVSENCKWLVVWSDKSASYVCVEPVFCGKPGTFGKQEHETYLLPGQTEDCRVKFFFEPA